MANNLITKIKNAGIIGAGGAGFPTYAKVDASVEYVLANCAECEPLIRSDMNLIRLHAEDICQGLNSIVESTGASYGVLAIKAKHVHEIEALEKACKNYPALRVHPMDDFYPAGDEQQIIYEVTGRVIEPGSLPLSVGCIVLNAQTLCQIKEADSDIPVTHRMVTVAGAVNKPFTADMPIGTPISHLLEMAGGPSISDYVVVMGGPLMGRISSNPDNEFMTKTSNGVIVLPRNHELIVKKSSDIETQFRVAKSACCQCSYCTLLCPRGNLGLGVKPNKVMQGLTIKNGGLFENGNVALACSNCGLCTYVGCNMGLTPHRFVQELRGRLLANKVKWSGTLEPANELRDYSKIPSKRIIQRVGLSDYDRDTEFIDVPQKVKKVRLSLRQHIGAPSQPVVKKGDEVKVGQTIANAAENALSVPVHASINGKVSAIGDGFIEITG